MAPRFADQILSVFDVPAEAYDFLAGILEDRAASPHDLKIIFDQSLMAGAESWYHQLNRARNPDSNSPLDSSTKETSPAPEEPWAATDRLIQQAESLARAAADGLPPHFVPSEKPNTTKSSQAAKRKENGAASHYWCQDGDARGVSTPAKRFRLADLPSTSISRLNVPPPDLQSFCVYPEEPAEAKPGAHTNAGTSPYFMTPTKPPRPVVPRPSPGTVSCIPFPPLSADSFGLIQEQVAHEPFWLLMVVTFLIKTKGEHAIPTFLRVKERFPAPCDIASPSNTAEIIDMIRHLGLCQNRLAYMRKYAEAFMFNPPRPGVRYPVRQYGPRELARDSENEQPDDAGDGWEIGHLTKGRYTIDSWRIFCRDVLLGKAKDWDGKGREAEFQPEWMRVLPADKELRAYLRWMWMREGWEWNPATGEKTVLREEMRLAVEEGRVKYDIYGGLEMLNCSE